MIFLSLYGTEHSQNHYKDEEEHENTKRERERERTGVLFTPLPSGKNS